MVSCNLDVGVWIRLLEAASGVRLERLGKGKWKWVETGDWNVPGDRQIEMESNAGGDVLEEFVG